jgi:hypothetical protein
MSNVIDTELVQRSRGLPSAQVYEFHNEPGLLGLTKMLQSISDTKEKGSDTLRPPNNERRFKRIAASKLKHN